MNWTERKNEFLLYGIIHYTIYIILQIYSIQHSHDLAIEYTEMLANVKIRKTDMPNFFITVMSYEHSG